MIDYTPKKKKTEEKFSNKYSSGVKFSSRVSPVQSGYNPRETARLPSLVTMGGNTSLKSPLKYTGNELVGISIIHKSCLQPVFNQQSAKDAASMRR